jgi:exosortase
MAQHVTRLPAVTGAFVYAALLIGAIGLFWAPVFFGLAKHEWSTDQGAHGPLILATGIWLLVRELYGQKELAQAGNISKSYLAITLSIIIYLIGSRSGVSWIQAFGALICTISIIYLYAGKNLLLKIWFPILYLFFIIPPPISMTGPFIRALKLEISEAAVDVLSPLGFDVANSGSSIFIDQYEVTVAAACAGLNSLVSLLAIGLLYIYLFRRFDWRYSLILVIFIFPIAVIANFIRVIMLLLATHYSGEAFAQGAFHEAAGLTMFMVTLAGLVLFDQLFAPIYMRIAQRENGHA